MAVIAVALGKAGRRIARIEDDLCHGHGLSVILAFFGLGLGLRRRFGFRTQANPQGTKPNTKIVQRLESFINHKTPLHDPHLGVKCLSH